MVRRMLTSAECQRTSRRATVTRSIVAISSLVLSILAACSLTVSPGDYAQGDGDAAARVVPPVPPGGARLLLLAGQRETFNSKDNAFFIQETAQAIVQADGTIGGFYYDRAPPLSVNRYAQALIEDGKVITSGTSATRGPQIAFAPLDTPTGALTGDWSLLAPDGSVQDFSSTFLVRPSLFVSMGGTESVALEDGGTAPVWNGKVFTASIDLDGHKAGGLALLNGASLASARGQARPLVYKDFLFAVGGRNEAGFVPDVDVSRLGADGTPGPYQATSPLPIATRLSELTTGAGKLFALGGLVDGDHPTDKVFFATIQDDGTLGTWGEAPPLPASLALGAGLFYKDKLYYFGGIRQSIADGGGDRNDPVDTIYALDIAANGTPGAAWREVGKLPSPRGGLAAVIF